MLLKTCGPSGLASGRVLASPGGMNSGGGFGWLLGPLAIIIPSCSNTFDRAMTIRYDLAVFPDPIFLRRYKNHSYDASWNRCVESVRSALDQAGILADQVMGLGFDATCSLVVLDAAGRPVSVSPSGNDTRNVIVWMDHRAIEQAERINATKDEVLKYVGGVISPEMESPKLLWLKEQMPAAWERAG